MKCINCGGELRYDPASFGLVCDYCGAVKQLHRPEEQAVVGELDFNTAERDDGREWGLIRRGVSCRECGAVTLYDPNQIAGSCPYCGSSMLLSAEDTKSGIAPNGVIPFSISKEEVIAKFYKWNKWALWSPEEFRTGKVLGNLVGVYIPFWTFDADSVSTYNGRFGYDRSVGDNTRTDWYNRSGAVDVFVDDYSVCGSRRFTNDKLLKSVIAFGPNDVVPYTPEALMGFAAEKYSVGIDEAWNMARFGLRKRMEKEACWRENADHYDKLQISTEYSNIRYKYVLVPVWLTACRYKGKVYNVVASGHNGRGNCKRPVSVAKIVTLAIIVASFPTVSFIIMMIIALIMGWGK